MTTEFVYACPLCGANARATGDGPVLTCVCCSEPLSLEGLARLAARAPVMQLDKEHAFEAQVFCQLCGWSFPAYLCRQQESRILSTLREALLQANEGRNLGCWPLCSFGGKDADLSPSGCTGIQRIVGVQREKVLFRVGGHKTISDSSCLPPCGEGHRKAFDDTVSEHICHCGYSADYDGDDSWTVHFMDTIGVPLTLRGEKLDQEATVAAVLAEAKSRTDAFEKEMAYLDELINEFYHGACVGIMVDVAVAAGPHDLEALRENLHEVWANGDPETKKLMELILTAAKSGQDFNEAGWIEAVERQRHEYARLMDLDPDAPPF